MSYTLPPNLTFEEAAAVTGLSVGELKLSVKYGELDAFRIGSAVFISKAAIEPYMAKFGLKKPSPTGP